MTSSSEEIEIHHEIRTNFMCKLSQECQFAIVQPFRKRSDCGNAFLVSDENKKVRMVHFEPHNRQTLRNTSEILQQLMKNSMGAAHLKSLHFKADSIIGKNYLLTSAYSLQINEVFKLANHAFTPGCCLNVAFQSLQAIRQIHQAGFIHRNINPASFSIGHSMRYESVPDYHYGKSMNLDMMACDWEGSLNMDKIYSISMRENKSVENEFSGMETGSNAFDNEKNTSPRKLNVNDTLKNGKFAWKVADHLGSGGFGDVYKVYDENSSSKMYYALKVESEEEKKTMLRLKVEMQVLMSIQEDRKNPRKIGKNVKRDSSSHFVEYVDCGKNTDIQCKFIVMSLVGPSLDDIRKKRGIKLDEGVTPFNIALQSLESVQDLHFLGYLHRDIKTANFAVGLGPAEAMIFMLDFGIGRSFLDSAQKHRAPRKSVKFIGTLRYASRACLKGIDQGRRDDLECWLYMMYDIFNPRNGLFWKTMKRKAEIIKAKESLFSGKVKERDGQSESPDVLAGWRAIVQYIDSLTFTCAPNYEKIMRDVERCAGAEGWTVKAMRNEGIWVGHLDDALKESTFEDSKSASSEPSRE